MGEYGIHCTNLLSEDDQWLGTVPRVVLVSYHASSARISFAF